MEPQHSPNKNSNEIYFLIAVILALLGTNAFLFVKNKKSDDRIVTISDEKTRMQTEIDKIEAELDKANNSNVRLTEVMKSDQELARQKINELRESLKKGQLTQGQLARAQESIKQLRFFVTQYAADIDDLKKRNVNLTLERDSLKSNVTAINAKAADLEKQNEELNTKVKVAAALRTASIAIEPLRIRNNGKETEASKASSTEKLRINFTVSNNPIAEKGMHTIFIRVIDPNGNLVTTNNSDIFIADGDELQHSYKTAIEFSNDGKSYNIDWTNPKEFQKGTYTVVLYADGYTMGSSTINFRR